MAVSDHMARSVLQAINEQMDRHTFHDVTIIVKEDSFECHRFLLSACSTFFRAMFSSDKNQNSNKVVKIKGIDSETFSLVLDSIYRGKYVLNPDNVTNLWQAASKLQIEFLVDSCEMFLAKQLSNDNCIDIYMNAKLLNSQMLLKMSWDLIVKKFELLRKNEKILSLDYDDMIKLVLDDTLAIPSEDVVIDTVLRWVSYLPENSSTAEIEQPLILSFETSVTKKTIEKENTQTDSGEDNKTDKNQVLKNDHSTDMDKFNEKHTNYKFKRNDEISNREEFLPHLLLGSRICLASATCVQALTEHKMVSENKKAWALVMEALQYHLQPGRRHDYCPPYAIHRTTSQYKNVTVAIFRQAGQAKVSCRTLEGTWFKLTQPPYPLYKYKAVTFENDIYATAATAGCLIAYKYEITTNSWRGIAQLKVARNNHALVCLDGYIYAVGGDNCTAIERFNAKDEQTKPGSGYWETVGNLTSEMTNIVATTLGNNIVVFGSVADNAKNPSTMIQYFDTQTMTAHTYSHDMGISYENAVTFKNRDNTYILLEAGTLWKLISNNKSKFSLEFHGSVWDSPIELSAAAITNQEIVILAKSVDPQMPQEWETAKFPEFKRVKILQRDADFLLNSVIAKAYLTVADE